MPRATTVRFSDEVFARLDQASARTGMPVNSIVVAACLEWMQRHTPDAAFPGLVLPVAAAPRWATLRRAVEMAAGRRGTAGVYPFERFTAAAQKMLTTAQAEAEKGGFSYIGTEHLLLAAFAEESFHAATVLASLGIAEQAVREALERVVTTKPMLRNPGIIPTSRVKKVVELAFKLSAAASAARVSTAHILLALVAEEEGIAAHILKDMGASTKQIESAMDALTEPEA